MKYQHLTINPTRISSLEGSNSDASSALGFDCSTKAAVTGCDLSLIRLININR